LIAAGAALHYLFETQHNNVSHITKLTRIEEDHYVWLDQFTIRNLELLDSSHENAVTLLQVLDQTLSPMGSRLLRKWMLLPLRDKILIQERHEIVDLFIKHDELSTLLVSQIRLIGDLERLISKVAVSRVSPREVVQIQKSLLAVEHIKKYRRKSKSSLSS
jgi:DNA mismatch repair protein MutS